MKVSLNQNGNIIDTLNVSEVKASHLKNDNYIKYIDYNKNSTTIEKKENSYKVIHYSSVDNIENFLTSFSEVKNYIKNTINKSRF